jgi:asparagine synthase (glutamine-hydrolysing)
MLARTFRERKQWHGLSFGEQFARHILPLLPAKLASLAGRSRKEAVEPDWLGSELLRSRGNPKGALAVAVDTLGLEPVRDIATLCVMLTYASNLQTLLHYEDRNSMAHSIEARVPFLDHPLVEFSLSLGNEHKLVGGDTKRVLRRAMSGVIPDDVRDRRDKLGFSTPEAEWFRGPLRSLVIDGVEATLRRFPDLLDPGGVRTLVGRMLDGHRPVDFTVWRLVNLGIWGERFGVSV